MKLIFNKLLFKQKHTDEASLYFALSNQPPLKNKLDNHDESDLSLLNKLNQSLGTPGSRQQKEANSCLRVTAIEEEHTCSTRGSDFSAILYTYN